MSKKRIYITEAIYFVLLLYLMQYPEIGPIVLVVVLMPLFIFITVFSIRFNYINEGWKAGTNSLTGIMNT